MMRVGASVLLGLFAIVFAGATFAEKAPSGETIDVNGGQVRLIVVGKADASAQKRFGAWAKRSAEIVAGYYGRFPIARTDVVVKARSGSGIGGGVSYRESEGLINISVGTDTTEEELRADWVLVHEMIHLALPNVRRRHTWLSEGLATYVEGIARVQAGNRPAADVWFELMRSMPQGLPRSGDRGLDNTPTWGRTYWGGALFCLIADVKIRERTNGRLGLQDALRAVADKSRGDSSLWRIEAVLKMADEALGVPALSDLYAEWKGKPVSPDLDALWISLGVVRDGKGARLDDEAPKAAIRRAIMAPRVVGAVSSQVSRLTNVPVLSKTSTSSVSIGLAAE